MAQIISIGSSSYGNCYLLETETECLIIEAGIKWSLVKPYVLPRLRKIKGVLVSHEHQDHARSVADFTKYRIKVLASGGTIDFLASNLADFGNYEVVPYENATKVGNFEISAFIAVHDAVEPVGFIIRHPEVGKMVFATDTADLYSDLADANIVMLECNYNKELLYNAYHTKLLRKQQMERIQQTHMEMANAVTALKTCRIASKIILIHLSDRHSNQNLMRDTVQRATGIPVVVTPSNSILTIKI